MSRVLVDGDIIAYRHSYKAQSEDLELDEMRENIDDMISYVADATTFGGDTSLMEFYLTGETNFRTEIATIAPYKGTRRSEKPIYLKDGREYLVQEYGAVTSVDEEADDLIAIRATELGPSATIASIDKDFLQVPCKHYNWNRGTHVTVSYDESVRFFYTQLLTGDSADNIKGVPNVGPKKAEKILGSMTKEDDMYRACIHAYSGDLSALTENARLLWLRRTPGELWEPPVLRRSKSKKKEDNTSEES